MKPRLALIISGVLAFLFGLSLAFLPAQMLQGFGLAAPVEAVLVSRDGRFRRLAAGSPASQRGPFIGVLPGRAASFVALVDGGRYATSAWRVRLARGSNNPPGRIVPPVDGPRKRIRNRRTTS